MLCVDVRAEMTAYLAEELDPEVRFQLDAHLAGCAPCRAELEAFREIWGTLGALPSRAASPMRPVPSSWGSCTPRCRFSSWPSSRRG